MHAWNPAVVNAGAVATFTQQRVSATPDSSSVAVADSVGEPRNQPLLPAVPATSTLVIGRCVSGDVST